MKNAMPYAVALTALCFAGLTLSGCSERASVEGAGGGKLTLVKPAAVVLHRGTMAKTEIRIQRENLPGEVKIRFANLPSGVDVVEPDTRIVGERGTYTLRASATADLVENHSADVTASAGPGGIGVSEAISISVRATE